MTVVLPPLLLERLKEPVLVNSLTSLESDASKTNQHTAKQYDDLGLANYEAIESFQRWQRK